MKTAIVHLSDIHMDTLWDFKDITKKIAQQINLFESEKVILVVTGDLTNSGQNEQFDRVDAFFASLKKEIKLNDEQVYIVFVPGNHDIQYGEEEKRNRDVLKQINDSLYFDSIDDELIRFSNFYSFSEIYDLPNEMLGNGFSLQYKDINLNSDLKFRFYLLNNVTFSTYKADNNEDSCGAVHIPPSLLTSIKLEPNTINFLLMHFPVYYFDESSYASLKKNMPFLTYVLCGHVHQNEMHKIASDNDLLCSVSISPALYKETINRLGMAILVFDESKLCLERYSYEVIDNGVIIQSGKSVCSSIRLIKGQNPLMKHNDFANDLLFAGFDGICLNDYFVFPELYCDSNEQVKKITDVETLTTFLNKKNVIAIDGVTQSGKTTLLHKLFFDLDSIGIPLYIDFSKCGLFEESTIDEIINARIREEYQDNYGPNVFNGIDLNQRIALIDNFQINESSKKTVDLLLTRFGKIIFTTSGTTYGMTEYEKIASKSLLGNIADFFDLRPMFKEKRYELIERRYKAICNHYRKRFKEDEMKIIHQKVQMILDKYVGPDSNYPYFINKVIGSVTSDDFGYSSQSTRVYSRIYENYINGIIIDSFSDHDYVPVVQELLKTIAYDIIRKDSYSVKYSDFHESVSRFFEAKKIRKIRKETITSTLLNKKVLVEADNDSYAFGSPDFLAFFAAQYFSSLLDDDFESNKYLLIEYLNKNYDDVVSKFLLFVVNLASTKTSLYLIEQAEKFVTAYDDVDVVNEEWALNDEEFKCLHKLTNKDKQELRSRINEKEAERYESGKKNYKKNVDEGREIVSDEDIKLYCKCFGLLDIISGMLPDLKVILDEDDQNRCIELLYRLVVITFRLGFGYLTDDFVFFSNKVKDFSEKIGYPITDDYAKRLVIGHCRATFLAIIDHAIRRAHTKLTEEDLEGKSFARTDTKRLVRLMSALHDDNSEDTFEKFAEDYFNHFKSNPFARNCISLMVRNYVSWYLSEDKAVSKSKFLKKFLKDNQVVKTTIDINLKNKKD